METEEAIQAASMGLFRFKSYYVVWKHARGERVYKNPISLNRTMQYGNQAEATEKKQKEAV